MATNKTSNAPLQRIMSSNTAARATAKTFAHLWRRLEDLADLVESRANLLGNGLDVALPAGSGAWDMLRCPQPSGSPWWMGVGQVTVLPNRTMMVVLVPYVAEAADDVRALLQRRLTGPEPMPLFAPEEFQSRARRRVHLVE